MSVTSKRLEQLLQCAFATLPSVLHDRVVIFGSAPMVLAEIRDDVRSLDLFTSSATFADLEAASFPVVERTPGVPCIVLGEDVAIFKTFPGVAFEDVRRDAKPTGRSRGFLVASLGSVLAFKLAAARTKDADDVLALRRELARRAEPLIRELRVLSECPSDRAVFGDAGIAEEMLEYWEEIAEEHNVTLYEEWEAHVDRGGDKPPDDYSHVTPNDLPILARQRSKNESGIDAAREHYQRRTKRFFELRIADSGLHLALPRGESCNQPR